MPLDDLVTALDAWFGIERVSDDDWSDIFASCYPDASWRGFVEPRFLEIWNGLMIRGAAPTQVATCVFPGDDVIAQLDRNTFLFSEHPLDFADRPGFLPISVSTFAWMKDRGISLYVTHAPLDQHPGISPSRLLANAIDLADAAAFHVLDDALDGGAGFVGRSTQSLVDLAATIQAFLGADIPVDLVRAHRAHSGITAVVAGGGASVEALQDALDLGCETFVTGNAISHCELGFVQEEIAAFRRLAEQHSVSLISATHYGSERPPQIEMLNWFRSRGLPAKFIENGPK